MPCEFACLTGFLPGSKLNARLFHREATRGRSCQLYRFPGAELMDVQSLGSKLGPNLILRV